MPHISSLEALAGLYLTFCYVFLILPDNLAIPDVFSNRIDGQQALNWESGFQW
jgi:hypothetical protein